MDFSKINISVCHQIPKRSFFWKGKQFPFCARCTGIHLGYLSFPLFLFGIIGFDIWVAIILLLPTYLDGFIQAYFGKESNNTLRFITGLISGIGAMSLMNITGKIAGDILKSLFI